MSSLDRDGFFNKSVMCDNFKTSGKEPDFKDKLTMFVMGVSNTSIQDFNNLVGNGSRSQDLSWEERNNFLTWPPVSPNNRLNYQHVITSVPISELKTDLSPIKVEETGPWYERCHWKINFWWWNVRHIVFRIANLIYKKGEKLWQSVVISIVVGIDVVGARCSTELTALQSFPTSYVTYVCSAPPNDREGRSNIYFSVTTRLICQGSVIDQGKLNLFSLNRHSLSNAFPVNTIAKHKLIASCSYKATYFQKNIKATEGKS